ncbi:glycosyl transferase [Acinetobacter tandoii]|uniref:M66 family metalloprotease n=1 Tax=Acinetobacter tandoii TaxID=202954 RepID=UPI000C2061B4|nr:M66 family metalloprotease [Acinetobacter tandoii]PJG42889.1 glycosyl transferase [Acinetobacter tandoii]
MNYPLHILSVCITSILLTGCGGGGGDSAGGGTSNPDSSIDTTPNQPLYPEPSKDVLDEETLGFYDYDANSSTRVIRSDLTGTLQAMVQFAQAHVVDPSGNEAKNMPRLTSEREALLLVTPTAEMGDVQQLELEIYQDGLLVRRVKLNDPSQIPLSDQSNQDQRPQVLYSKRAWSTKLNWDEVQSGLKLKLIDGSGRTGELLESQIDFAPPGELVLNNIRLGLLAVPPISTGHYMLLEPEKAGTDYFQTIPAAEMTVAKYDDMKLSRVMVANGTIYDTNSAVEGGVYSGDMRENVAKSTFSVGINLANWGVTSASMASQEQPQLTESVIVHHARGKYSNGDQTHGLSGGNGMLTLIDSVGNEFSHEIGHHYGLGHYPGSVTIEGQPTNYFWSAHHADSGWGYISFRDKMRGNLNWKSTSLGDGANGVPNFLKLYPYGWDAMAGGATASSISRYTHYTGYSTSTKIQPHFNRYMWDANSSTGYLKWNATTRKMDLAQPRVPSSSKVWYNRADGNYLKPRLFGVPVYTILGGYDPVNQVGLLYPAARSNWGNVFTLPEVTTTATQAACWLKVVSVNGSQTIALAPNRMDATNSPANKLHVNLAISDQPQHVDLYCKKTNEAEKLLSSIDIPTYTDAIQPAVKIGRESGYAALRKVELPSLEQALLAQSGQAIVALSANEQLLYDAYRNNRAELSVPAQQVLTLYESQQQKIYRLNRWMNVYAQDLAAEKMGAETALAAFIQQLGLETDTLLNQQSTLLNKTNCLKVEKTAAGQYNPYISGSTACTGDDSEKWILDALGRIHSKWAMDQCLTSNGSGNKITLATCSTQSSSQIWSMAADTQSIRQGSQCFDLNKGYLVDNRADLIRYSCTNGANQKWSMLVPNNNLILSYLKPKNLAVLTN